MNLNVSQIDEMGIRWSNGGFSECCNVMNLWCLLIGYDLSSLFA